MTPAILPPDALVLLDYVGIAVFAVSGALLAAEKKQTLVTFIFFAVATGVGGGTVRDVLIGRIPAVLHSGLYAIPALIGAAVTVAASRLDMYGLAAAAVAATACFAVRLLGIVFALDAPRPPQSRPSG